MSKSRIRKSARNDSPPVAVLRQLVVPAFEERAPDPTEDGPSFGLSEPDPESAEAPAVRGRLHGDRLVHVQALPVDELRTLLRFSLLAGHFIADASVPALFVGNLLETTPFHVRSADTRAGSGSSSSTQYRDASGRLTGNSTTNGSPAGSFTGTHRDASGRLTASSSGTGKCKGVVKVPVTLPAVTR